MIETTNVSTYELLVKPIINNDNPPNRTVIQGYFLTIANPNSSNLEIDLTFKATTPNFDSSLFAAFWDVDGNNVEVFPLLPEPPCVRIYRFNLPSLDTGLFLLLPDVRNEEVITDRDTEIRGYVRLSIVSATPIADEEDNVRTLLLSAQQRGTFLPQGAINPPEVGDFDQFSYSLPLANGGSEVTLETNIVPPAALNLPPRRVIFDAIEKNPRFLSSITSDPFAQRISQLSVDEQRKMLDILLDRFEVRQVPVQ